MDSSLVFWGAVASLAFVGLALSWRQGLQETRQKYEALLAETHDLATKRSALTREQQQLVTSQDEFQADARRREEAIRRIAEEKKEGFPWLAEAYAEFFYLEDMKTSENLRTKRNPAPRAADEVKRFAQERRQAIAEARVQKYLVAFYESIAPWLAELRDPDLGDYAIAVSTSRRGDSKDDPARSWLSDGEYRSLSSTEKFDLALKRYQNRKKTRWEVGRDYERFIGWTLESKGYRVQYTGIVEGFDDLGRDLVARLSNDVVIVQCKRWSQEKLIHEKHVFQLYGTKVAYQVDNPGTNVAARLVTTTKLSDRAKQFAVVLGIEFTERQPLGEYPLVKCNVATRTGERIYHLPFDQQYDSTVIDPKRGEYFLATAREAEALGFRRAFRWRGDTG